MNDQAKILQRIQNLKSGKSLYDLQPQLLEAILEVLVIIANQNGLVSFESEAERLTHQSKEAIGNNRNNPTRKA